MLESNDRDGFVTTLCASALDMAWEELECRIVVPRQYVSDFHKEGALHTMQGDGRRFPRFHYHVRGVLHCRQTFPAMPRREERYLVLTKNLSRCGLSFLHEQQLFPHERMALNLAGGKHVDIEVARCKKHNDRCFEIGAVFLGCPPECE